MKYHSIVWNPNIAELRNIEDDELVLIKNAKQSVDLYATRGNLETDISFKFFRIRDTKPFTLEHFKNSSYSLI